MHMHNFNEKEAADLETKSVYNITTYVTQCDCLYTPTGNDTYTLRIVLRMWTTGKRTLTLKGSEHACTTLFQMEPDDAASSKFSMNFCC